MSFFFLVKAEILIFMRTKKPKLKPVNDPVRERLLNILFSMNDNQVHKVLTILGGAVILADAGPYRRDKDQLRS